MSLYRIPFNRACLCGEEFQHISSSLEAGHISGDGPYTKKARSFLEKQLGVEACLLTTSCTHALEMSALLLGLQEGDEVILPSFTFVSTANAFVLRGAKPVFVDVRQDTLNLDETLVEERITSRTRAIVSVHYAGVGCEMDALLAIAEKHGLDIIEDNAHGLFGRYKGTCLGTFGRFATQSFHETKNFTCGEGGALLVNRPEDVLRAEIIREKGTNRTSFARGEVDKYTWVDIGSSYVMSDILAAFLYAQISSRDAIQLRRRQIWEGYMSRLSSWACSRGISLPHIPAHCEQAYHMFYVLLPTAEIQQAVLRNMKEKGILCVFHYLPLHLSPMGVQFGGEKGDCPVTESVSQRLIRLPFFTEMTDIMQDEICETLMHVYAEAAR